MTVSQIFMSMSDCPVCQPPETCHGYPHLWLRLRQQPGRYREIHDRVNAIAAGQLMEALPPTAAVGSGCGGCGSH
jgi:hypothetical protein